MGTIVSMEQCYFIYVAGKCFKKRVIWTQIIMCALYGVDIISSNKAACALEYRESIQNLVYSVYIVPLRSWRIRYDNFICSPCAKSAQYRILLGRPLLGSHYI